MYQFHRRFVLYDMKVNAETRTPQVLWEQDEDIFLSDQSLATSEEGQWVVYLSLNLGDTPQRQYVCVMSIRGCLFNSQLPL